jgi:hypothetical protein
MKPILQNLLIRFSQLLLKAAASKNLKQQLPRIYEKLDQTICIALFNYASPQLIKLEIKEAIESATMRPATSAEIQIISALYDPLKNAQRTQRKRQ